MEWDKVQQVLRIILFAAGGYIFGADVVEGEMFNQLIGGVMAIGAFAWWLIWEKNTKHIEKE